MNRQAFSLVELLVVISVIAIVASLAIPNLSSITSQAHFAKDERNAQTIASLAASAQQAGATNQWNSVAEAVADLEDQIEVPVGGTTLVFGISSLSDAEITGAESFLTVESGVLVYSGYSN